MLYELTSFLTTIAAASASIVAILGGYIASKLISLDSERNENIDRIKEIKEAVKIPLVLHGGSGVPDEQIQAAIKAGIGKVNFGTDLCYSFIDKIFETDRSKIAIDVFMYDPIDAVKEFAVSKIKLLGASGRA